MSNLFARRRRRLVPCLAESISVIYSFLLVIGDLNITRTLLQSFTNNTGVDQFRAARQRDASYTRQETHLKLQYQTSHSFSCFGPLESLPQLYTTSFMHIVESLSLQHCFFDRCMSYTADVSIVYSCFFFHCISYVPWHQYTRPSALGSHIRNNAKLNSCPKVLKVITVIPRKS